MSMVEVSGTLLSGPVLVEAFPAGLEKPADESEQVRLMRLAYEDWQANQREARLVDPAVHWAWVRSRAGTDAGTAA